MEPLSALSVAASVLQFVDFGTRLFHSTYEIYQTGSTTERVNLAQVAEDLSALTAKVDERYEAAGKKCQGGPEEAFLRLCQQCNSISKELQVAIGDVKVHDVKVREKIPQIERQNEKIKRENEKIERKIHDQASYSKKPRLLVQIPRLATAASSFGEAVSQVWEAKRIAGIKERLTETREQTMFAVLLLLWDETQQNQAGVVQFRTQQDEILRELKQLINSTTALKADGVYSSTDHSNEIKRQLETKVQIDWSRSAVSDLTVPGLSDHSISDSEAEKITKRILLSLYYESIDWREKAIPEAHQKTFRWVFERPRSLSDGKPAWSDFSTWLKSQTRDPYWISGKPGAGKSTLARYISQHRAFGEHLREWAQGKQVVIAHYFSWNSGSLLQKSQEGLLRTLMCQCITQKPDLATKLMPKRYMLLHDFQLLGPIAQLPEWELPELLDCFRALLSQTDQDFRLALVIDGLDEFEGSLDALVSLLQTARLYHGVKVCVSSRPWNVFSDAFAAVPYLRLENLTRDDISSFVQHEFELSRGFQELKELYPGETSDLLGDLVDKSKGVFMWVDLVVQTLLKSLADGDHMADLQKTLDGLPEDLSELYNKIWQRIEQRHRREASEFIRILEIAKTTEQSVSLSLLWFCYTTPTGSNAGTQKLAVMRGVDTPSARVAWKYMLRRLNSRTKGILEAPFEGDSAVDYIHRTAREWVAENWDLICSECTKDYDPALVMVKVEMLVVRAAVSDLTSSIAPRHMTGMLKYAQAVAKPNNHVLFKLLDEFAESFDTSIGCIRPCWLRDTEHKPQNCFLSLCARVPLTEYVQAKIMAEPRNFDKGRHFHSVLSAAVNGFDGVSHDATRLIDLALKYDSDRLMLVEFILKFGVYSAAYLYEIQTHIRQQPPPPLSGILSKTESEKNAYYESVVQVFKAAQAQRGPGIGDWMKAKMARKSKQRYLPYDNQI